jgi:hypothetical protein
MGLLAQRQSTPGGRLAIRGISLSDKTLGPSCGAADGLGRGAVQVFETVTRPPGHPRIINYCKGRIPRSVGVPTDPRDAARIS